MVHSHERLIHERVSEVLHAVGLVRATPLRNWYAPDSEAPMGVLTVGGLGVLGFHGRCGWSGTNCTMASNMAMRNTNTMMITTIFNEGDDVSGVITLCDVKPTSGVYTKSGIVVYRTSDIIT